ncbi:nitroreductase family protein [Parabacteroides provencensis]|uniref:nitroreductase family protein n=1 Tax=Parabacteroides provencensis TaxID=1944636 RepID=UPI000C152529|nr:nitroreductase family protein [Parabacteroides provencensis]
MVRNFKEAIKNRRSYYGLKNSSSITDGEIKEIIEFVVTHTPSAFNSQSTRTVLLLGENHKKLWQITKDILKKLLPEEAFKATESKINNSFESGYGTILFYEDMSVVEHLQKSFPTYKDNFPIWSYQTSGMHQFAIWTLLEDNGLGASLQHYNPLIDEAVAKEWNINPDWKLMAEMPFGIPAETPAEKQFSPLDKRVIVYK